MKNYFLFGLVALAGCALSPTQPAPAGGEKSFSTPLAHEKVEFISHSKENSGSRPYLAMNLPYAPYQDLLSQLQKIEALELKSRGEAHITVITPIEYGEILKKHLDMKEIEKIAVEAKIQDSAFTPVCIGKGEKEIKDKTEKTFFIVVDSQALLDLRGLIEAAYIKKGGKTREFIPERFSPHITLGYTSRDLHLEDGIIKKRNSCLYNLK